MSNPWKPIKTYRRKDRFMHKVDLWMAYGASSRTMGMSDAFRVPDAWQRITDGKWVHYHRGAEAELATDYITHWMPRPLPPVGTGASPNY